MKEQFTTNAINLKSYNFGEADKIIVMYSKEKGIIRGVAKGIKKAKSKLGGRMDLFVANKILLNKGRNLDTVCQAEALNTFLKIRTDSDKLLWSMYCSEIVANLGIENDPNSNEIYNLFYSLLDNISKSESRIQILLNVLKFQLKICEISGYGIMFEHCSVCGKAPDENIFFSVEHGGIICEKCSNNISKKTKIPVKLAEFLNECTKTNITESTRYDSLVTEKITEVCVNLLKNYIEYYSPKQFKTVKVMEGIR